MIRHRSVPNLSIVLLAILASWVLPATVGADGSLDPEFSGDGRASFDLVPGFQEAPDAIAIDSRGRVVVAGTVFNPSMPNRGFVARFNPDGTADTGFSGDGLHLDNTGDNSTLSGLAIDGQDRVLAAGGSSSAGPGFDFLALRLDSGGTLDPGFSGDGRQTINFNGNSTDIGNAATLDSEGRFVIAGYTVVGGTIVTGVARLGPGGEPDPAFNGSGTVTPVTGSFSSGNAVRAEPGGKLLVAGSRTLTPASSNFSVMQLTASGTLDPGFSGDGLDAVDFGYSANESLTALAIDGSGRIVLSGILGNSPESYETGVARLLPGGGPDLAFSEDGRTTSMLDDPSFSHGMDLDRAGRIVTAGATFPAGGGSGDAAVLRFTGGGGLDPAFGAGGLLREDYLGGYADAQSVTVDSQGRYVIAGRWTSGADDRLGLARFDVDYPEPPPPAAYRCSGRSATVVGTEAGDRLKGTGRRDVIAGLGGNDVIRGLGGNDLICGGTGKDRLVGGRGNDLLLGQAGFDTLLGGPGRDRLDPGGVKGRNSGGPGKDRCMVKKKYRPC